MSVLVKQISLLCLFMGIGEQLLKDKSSTACLRMIVAGKIAISIFSYTKTILEKCGI